MDENKHPNQSSNGQENKEVEQSRKLDNQKVDPQTGQKVASQTGPNAQKGSREARKSNSPRRLFSKKWAYPAIYLGAAALIIGLMYVKSQMGGSAPATSNAIDTGTSTGVNTTTSTNANQPSQTTFSWPYASGTSVKLSLGFFSDKGSAKTQAAALVKYDNAYYPHEGYDLKSQSGQSFQVTAAASGKVISVEGNKLYGNTVVVDSGNGYTETYQSLGTTSVQAGDTVSQGQVIGTSGKNLFEESEGNHLYFQVSKDGQPIDPATVLPSQP